MSEVRSRVDLVAPDGLAPEHVVLLDALGLPCGTRPKETAHDRSTAMHLGFSCYLVDDDGRVLLTRRAADKRTWPGVWTNACCGHPQLGESLSDAVARRLHDELGVDPTGMELLLPDFAYRSEMADGTVEHELCPVVVASARGPFRPRSDEVSSLQWVPWDELVARAATDASLSPWCREQVAQLAAAGWRPVSPAPAVAPAVQRWAATARRLTAVADATAQDPVAVPRARARRLLEEFVAARVDALHGIDPRAAALGDAVHTLFGAGGKGLRPAFVHWGHRATGAPDDERVAAAGAALEMLHLFALLQDDVMDRSMQRRGAPTAFAAFTDAAPACDDVGRAEWFGASATVLASDLAFVWSDELLARAAHDAASARRARAVFTDLRTEVVCGQYLELSQVDGVGAAADVTAQRVALLKSGRYSVTRPLLLGAALGDAAPDRTVVDALHRYGDAVGCAFQLRDDVLGLFGDSTRTGKSTSDDLRAGKRTLLVLRALRLADARSRRVLEAALGDPDLDDGQADECRRIVRDCGALAAVEARIRHERGVALDALTDVPDQASDALAALADLVTLRSA